MLKLELKTKEIKNVNGGAVFIPEKGSTPEYCPECGNPSVYPLGNEKGEWRCASCGCTIEVK